MTRNPARLPIRTRPLTGNRFPISLAAVAVLALAAAAWWAFGAGQARPQPPRNLLLITVDTLRADALGAYGNTTAATPWLDRLASSGVRFDNAHAHTVVTLPSHANILTGRLPPDHGVRDNSGFRVSPGEESLATRLKTQGFRTAAFISAFPLDSRFGLARGFDVYDDRFLDHAPRPAMLEQERAGIETAAAAERWLRAQDSSERWFCWVHLYEPHFPYTPPEPFATRFARDPYAGEVAATDAALGPLLDTILRAGASTRTMVVVTSDHGESLGEHEEATHGVFAYEATLKVPLVLYFPPLWQSRTVGAAVSHVDILPTILESLEIPAGPGLRGHSLSALARGEQRDDDVTYFEALSGSLNRGWAPLQGVISNGLKYIDLPIPELYDLRGDVHEARNLAPEKPAHVSELRKLLGSFAGNPIRPVKETSDVRERLRSLGYTASNGAGTRKTYTEKDDPKRLIVFDRTLQDVAGLFLAGRVSEALERSRALVKQRPDMRIAWLQLAQLEREIGDLPAGVAALRRALELGPDDDETVSLLGAYLTAADRPREAIDVLQPYATTRDPDLQVLIALALAQARAGRTADALGTLERARAQDPSNVMLLVHTATVRLIAGQRAEARRTFEAALALDAEVARAHSSLGAMDAEEGRHDAALAHWRAAIRLDPGECEKLLAIASAMARGGRAAEARPYIQLFAETAPPAKYAADIARAREWLTRTAYDRR
jgi:arylsulfatase A-like enzyme/tetratricopeptide (TPR) repeat protein